MIKMLKRKIYQCLRSHLDTNWTTILPQIVFNYNSTPNKGLGGIKPIDINSREDGPTIDAAIKAKSNTCDFVPPEPNFDNKVLPRKSTENELKVGSYVMLDLKRTAFFKNSNYQVKLLKKLIVFNNVFHKYSVARDELALFFT